MVAKFLAIVPEKQQKYRLLFPVIIVVVVFVDTAAYDCGEMAGANNHPRRGLKNNRIR